ncbi:MAG: SAM-dependent methyltransferase [Streptosporangiaceae bacterium]
MLPILCGLRKHPGGKDNYAADRKAGDALIDAYPTMVELARANRAFLGRAVRFLAGEAGIRQFLDIGTGIPAAGNTHQVAREVAPGSRVVYVDYDPIVLAHARALLASGPHGATDYIDADARNVGLVLERAADTLDFSQPVAVISLLRLHAISDEDDPHAIMARVMEAVPAGSYLTISHPASDIEPGKVADLQTRVNKLSYQQYTGRSRAEVMRFFTGLELVEPGLVQVHQWRPGIETSRTLALWAAVGRKPG